MSKNRKGLEDVLGNLRKSSEAYQRRNQINLPQPKQISGGTPPQQQNQQLQSVTQPLTLQETQQNTNAEVQNRINNASQRISNVGKDPTEITDGRGFIEKALNLPDEQNIIFDVFELLQRGQQSLFALAAPEQKGKTRVQESLDILAGNSNLFGGELIRRWANPSDPEKAKEDGTLDWTDFAGFLIDVTLDPSNLIIPGLRLKGKGLTLTEKGVRTVKNVAKNSGIKFSKGKGLELVKGGASKVKDVKKFAETVKETSKILLDAQDTARVVKAGGVSLNTFIWHTAVDNAVSGVKLGNNLAVKMMSAVDPTIAKSYTNFLGRTVDTLSRGGKELNRIVLKSVNNKKRLNNLLRKDAKDFDDHFEELYNGLDLSEMKSKLAQSGVTREDKLDSISSNLSEIFMDEESLVEFKEAFLSMGSKDNFDDVFKEFAKKSLMKGSVNNFEFMGLARNGMKGTDFVDYIINDSKKVLNYTEEGEVLFRSIFDNYDDIIRVVEADNGLKMFQFDNKFFSEANRNTLYDLISERTIKLGETSIDNFSNNQVRSINKALKKELSVDPKLATDAQKRIVFTTLKQPARIAYILEQAKKYSNLNSFIKEYHDEIATIVGNDKDVSLTQAIDFMDSLRGLKNVEGYADVRLAVFDLLSEFSPKTLAIKAEMLGVDISGVHKYMDDVKPKPPEIARIKPVKNIFKPKPKVSKVVSPEDMGNTIKPDDMIFKKDIIKTKFDPNVDGVNYRVFETTDLNSDVSTAILSDGRLLSGKDHSQIAKAITGGSADFYVDTFAEQGVIYYSRAQGDVADGLTLMVEPTQVQLDSIEKAIKSTKRKSKNGLRVFVELPGDKEARIFQFSAEEMKSANAGKMVTDKIKEQFAGKVPFTKTTKVLEENTVALTTAQKKILKLKKSEKLGKMGDELVASVEKKASDMGLVKLSPEEAQTVIQKTEVNIGMNRRNGDISEMVKLSDILPFTEYNRIDSPFGDVVKLAEDIKLNGFKEPIILQVNPETGFAYIGEGNHRLAVAVALGLDEIPVRTLNSKYAEPMKGKGGWFIDNKLIPSQVEYGTKYFRFDEAKPSFLGIEGRPIGLASRSQSVAPPKPGLKLNKEVAQRLSDFQEFDQYALKEIKDFANKLLKYKIKVGGHEINLIDFLGEDSKKFIMDATLNGKRNVIQAFRQVAETNPAIKAFLDEQTFADLMGKQEFDLLTGQSIIPKSSKPIFSLPAPNFYTPKDLEYFKRLGNNKLTKDLSEKYGEVIANMQRNIGRIEFGNENALLKTSMQGYSPHVMNVLDEEGQSAIRSLESVDDDIFVGKLKKLLKTAGIPQENADLFVFGRNKTLGSREFSMSAREANNVRNALLTENLHKSSFWDEDIAEEVREEITDYIKEGLFSEDARDSLMAMTTKKMSAINYGNKNIKILGKMAFGDMDNQYVQFIADNSTPKGRNMQALTTFQARQVLKTLNTVSGLAGGLEDEYVKDLIKMFKKASSEKGAVYVDKHVLKHMLPNADKNASSFLKFIDGFNNYFKAGKTLSPMFNVQNIAGSWSNMWFSGMDIADVAKGYTKSVSDYSKFKKIAKRIANLEISENMLNADEKKLYTEIMYFMDNGFFTGETALELMDVQKMLAKSNEAKTGVGALVNKAGRLSGLSWVAERNMQLNLYNDNINRLTLFRHAVNNPKYIKNLGLKLTGDTKQDAMNTVRFALFDPNDMSFFEQDYMKRLIPFYTFQRQNLAFQAQNFVKNSDKYYKIWKTYEGAWQEEGMDTNQLMQFEQDRMVLPVPFLSGDGTYTALRISTPFVDALDFMTFSGAKNRFMAATTPLVKAPYESVSGVSTFTGEPIERYKDEQSRNIPFLTKKQEWLIGQVGLDVPLRVATNAVMAGSDVATGDQEALHGNLSRATGIVGLPRTVAQNEIAKGYEQLEKLEGLINKLKEDGDVPTIREIRALEKEKGVKVEESIQKLATGNKYVEMIEQQKKLQDLINSIKGR